jgi:hypothetical protein
VIPDIKSYILNPIPSKLVLPEPIVASIAINLQMAVIQVQVGKNFIEYVLLKGGSKINIIMEKLRVQLGVLKLNPSPYNLRMANQTITKPLGLIKDLKILIRGIPYAVTFIIIQSSVLNSSYFMLLGRPWLRDAKVFHD